MTGKLKYSRLLRYFYIFPKFNLTPKNACFVNVIILQDCMWRYVKGGQGMWLIKKICLVLIIIIIQKKDFHKKLQNRLQKTRKL